MKKFRLMIILIVGVLLLASQSQAFHVTLTNDTDTVKNYRFIWDNCDWAGWSGSANMAGGELQSGAEVKLHDYNYKPGIYRFEWYGNGFIGTSNSITIETDQGLVVSTPSIKPIFIPGIQ